MGILLVFFPLLTHWTRIYRWKSYAAYLRNLCATIRCHLHWPVSWIHGPGRFNPPLPFPPRPPPPSPFPPTFTLDKDVWIIIDDVSDSVSYNKRMQAYFASQVFGAKVVYHTDGCKGHALHNAIVRVTKQDEIIGRLHAQQFIFSILGRRNTIHGALLKLVDSELILELGKPDPEWRVMAEDILAYRVKSL